MRYKITMKDGSERTMTLLNPETTAEIEVAKWTDAAEVDSIDEIQE